MTINQLAASKIRELRHKAGYKAAAVAKDLGVSKTAYSRLEHGHVEITLKKIEAIAAIYGIPIADMISDIIFMHQRNSKECTEETKTNDEVLQTIADNLLAALAAIKKVS